MAAQCNFDHRFMLRFAAEYAVKSKASIRRTSHYVMSDGDYEDDFYQSITPHEFYQRRFAMEKTPSTSQASGLAAIEAAWRRAAENGIPTVYLCFLRAAFRRTTQLGGGCLPR